MKSNSVITVATELKRAIQFLLIPVFLLSLNYFDNRWRVVADFKIEQTAYRNGVIILSGVLTKQRGCRFVEVVATNQNGYTIPVIFEDLRGEAEGNPIPIYSRALGPQRFGPWAIYGLRPNDAVELEARHYCHILWDHSETLASFLVKPHSHNERNVK